MPCMYICTHACVHTYTYLHTTGMHVHTHTSPQKWWAITTFFLPLSSVFLLASASL